MNIPAQTPRALLSPAPSDALEIWSDSHQWYYRSATWARRGFWVAEVVLVIITAAIPTAVALDLSQRIPAVLGGIAAVLTGLSGIFLWRDSWVRFTQTYTELETEKVFYQYGIGVYDIDDERARTKLFIERTRTIAGAETKLWTTIRQRQATSPADSRTDPLPGAASSNASASTVSSAEADEPPDGANAHDS